MKRFLLFMLSALFSAYASAQIEIQNEAPEKITTAFNLKYPNLTAKKWASKNNIYRAMFINDNKKSTATFDTNGVWKSTETDIASTRGLPTVIKDGFYKSEFSAWYIEKIRRLDLPEKTSYEFIVDNGNALDGDHHDAFIQKYLLEFATDGKLVSKTLLK